MVVGEEPKDFAVGNAQSLMKDMLGIGGIATLQAWSFVAFFSGFILNFSLGINGLPDRYWAFFQVGTIVAFAAVLFLFSRKGFSCMRSLPLFGSLLMAIGAILSWLGVFYLQNAYAFLVLGGVISGVGDALLMVGWLAAFAQRPAENPFLVLVVAFSVSFFVYVLLLFVPSIVCLVAESVLPFVSAACLHLWRVNSLRNTQDPQEMEKRLHDAFAARPLPQKKKMWHYVLALYLWFNLAYFRYIASPWKLLGEPAYYLSLIASALLVVALLAFWLYGHSLRDFDGGLLLLIAVLCVAYAILYIDFSNPIIGAAAFMLVFGCLVGVRITLHLLYFNGIESDVQGVGIDAVILLIISGAGIALGVFAGTRLCVFGDNYIPSSFPMILMLALFLLVYFVLTPSEAYRNQAEAVLASSQSSMPEEESSLGGQDPRVARCTQRFALSKRESEVLALLLKGRNRPFISQELFISIGTVNTHVSHIYSKMGVNSLQGLITVASEEMPDN